MSYLSQPAMIRQKSLENFTNSFFPEEQEFENRWADVLYGEMPTSPASSTSEFHVINQVEDDLDNLLNEVLRKMFIRSSCFVESIRWEVLFRFRDDDLADP